MPLSGFDPLVSEWFATRFQQATEPQVQGWPLIAAGHNVIVSAPTGSGKTLAAFLICIDQLVRAARAGTLTNETHVVYVSPLKALSNDVHRNLEVPLAEIAALAVQRGVNLAPIRTALRTGDTPMPERQRMIKQPPHILVTTPESLFILLTAGRPREMLKTTRTVIVDEIHAIADDKRGSHLALTLARLDALTQEAHAVTPQRIGLSATVKPIEEVAGYLAPNTRIVDIGHRRAMDLAIEVTNDELGAVASTEMWAEIYDRIARHILNHRTTLVFVNTRRLSERVTHALAERLGPGIVLPHHGSLSKALRFDAEARLKSGEIRAVVATASLELGIDIGTVDLAIQIGTPRSIAVALQRTGRSGHWVGAKPQGRFFPTTRDELIECAALVCAIRQGDLERIEIPENALDILAQQIVAETAAGTWLEEDLFQLIRRAYPYRNLRRGDFEAVVRMLSEGIATSRGRSGAMLHRDQVNGRIRGRRGARLAAITSGGAIPENASYAVIVEPEGKTVGTVDEDFAVESLAGDVFLLGTHSWRIRRVEPGRVRVEDAKGAAPSIPFWLGEAPGRSAELSSAVSLLRERIASSTGLPTCVPWLLNECGLDEAGAKQAIEYVRAGVASLGALPSSTNVVAERFFDEAGGMQLILHAPFGARINRAWGLALRKRFCRTFNFELQAAATDNGIVISLSDQHAFPLELVFEFLKPETLEDVLTQAMLPAPMFGARWRWNATRALAILRFRGGRKVPAPIQRMRSDDLLASVFPDQVACGENLTGPIRIPDHPLVNETIQNCLHEAMDLNGLQQVLNGIESGAIRTVAIDTPEPSFFSHEILNANPYAYLDDAPLEERRARAVQLRRTMRTDATGGAGILDPAAIEEVAAESWPDVRDADELHDALLTLITAPPAAEWQNFFDELSRDGRAYVIGRGGRAFWVATERRDMAADPVAVLRGWMESTGPSTASALSERLAFPRQEIVIALAQLEAEGQVLRGHFAVAQVSRPVSAESPDRPVSAESPDRPVSAESPDRSVSAESPDRSVSAESPDRSVSAESPDRPVSAESPDRPVSAESPDRPVSAESPDRSVSADVAQVSRPVSPDVAQVSRPVSADVAQVSRPVSGQAEIQWCNRRVLARIHRLTLGRLRREIEPVTAAQFHAFLHRWQHVSAGAQLHGADGLLQIVRQLQGYEIPAVAWESQTLRERVAKYEPDLLDELCLSGEVMWARVSPHPGARPTKIAPISLFLREDSAWLLASSTGLPACVCSHAAAEVLAVLEKDGASFFPDLMRATHRLASEVEDALWELVAAGLVTGDGFENLRALIDPKRRRGEGRGRQARPRNAAGRWALVRRGTSDPAAIGKWAEQLLLRWGVLFRDLLAREAGAPPWRELLPVLRRLEAQGQIRGGRFVSGFSGEQFARPEAIDLLRAVRRAGDAQMVAEVANSDPLNLTGIILPGPRVSPIRLTLPSSAAPAYCSTQA